MSNQGNSKIARIENYSRLIQRQAGKVVRPYRFDGYVNMLNKYGTQQDASEHYQFQAETQIADQSLTRFYEGNGLFAKIIDAPAEEAVKHGFELDDVSDQKIVEFYMSALDELDWEESFMQGIKWARLFAGAIGVMLINDGHGLEEPLDWKHIKSIDDIVVFERPLISPDWNSMYNYDPNDPFSTRGSRLGMPEYYTISSRNGTFIVHESRCLIFQNGKLPENTSNSEYQLWGTPEYLRIHRAIRDAEIAHGSAAKMLDRSIQAIYKMKNLSAELATEQGEDRVLKRLQTIDMARGLLNSITIDSEFEDYSFTTFQFTGVPDVIDATCNFLSALTSIPQTILFGRSPAGMNSTGESDLENWYNYVERMQKRMVRSNLRYLLSVIFQAGVATGEVDEVPNIKIKFNPLWSVSEAEAADLEQKKAQIQLTRAQTAQAYIDMQVIDPSEVRSKLADADEFDVENMLDEIDEDELYETYMEMQGNGEGAEGGQMPGGMPGMPGGQQPPTTPSGSKQTEQTEEKKPDDEGNSSEAAPAATKLPQDMTDEEEEEAEEAEEEKQEKQDSKDKDLRMNSAWDEWLEDHLEDFQSDKEQIAFRKKVQNLETVAEINAIWNLHHDSTDNSPVSAKKSLRDFILQFDPDYDKQTAVDGGPGSGNHGHSGRPGEIGGSAASPYGALSGQTKKALETVSQNIHGFGLNDDEKTRQVEYLKKCLKDDGAVCRVVEEDGHQYQSAVVPKLSYEENRTINKALNRTMFCFGFDKDAYIKACEEAGEKPRFHEEPEEVDKWDLTTPKGKLQSDGTPVFYRMTKEKALSDSELLEYSAYDDAVNPKGYEKAAESAKKAVESMSDDEVTAIRQYTKQYGPGTYMKVNEYLATGEGDDHTKKAAELIASATNHPIGVDCITVRGARTIHGTTDDAAVAKIVEQVSKGNYTKAGKLAEMLEGKTFTSDTAMSTSPGDSTSQYGSLPVQFLFKTPASAKAVDISQVSAYGGGRSEIEKKLGATGLFGTVQNEREVLFRPGTSYTIERVSFSFEREDKKKGQVFIVASINPDN